MKKFYDKLFLAIAALVLLAGAAFYVVKTGGAADQGAATPSQPKGEAYEAITVSTPAAKEASWPEPGAQSSGPEWIYDVFTPPQIFIDKEGNYTVIPPKPPLPPEPFGLYLAEIIRQPYRIQIQGFSGNRNKPEECVLFLFNEERKDKFFIKLGEKNDEAGVEVLNFTITVEIDEKTNTVDKTAIATIKDLRTGETINLIDGERLFKEEITVVFRSEEDPEIMVELAVSKVPEEGMSFKTSLGEYILKEISLEDQTVTVNKQATEESEAKTRTLSPPPPDISETTQPSEEITEAPAEGNLFEELF